jgi:quinol monooxygenase YgiN
MGNEIDPRRNDMLRLSLLVLVCVACSAPNLAPSSNQGSVQVASTGDDLVVLGRVGLQPGADDAFIAKLPALVRGSRAAAGNRGYIESHEPGVVTFYEAWADQAALDGNLHSDHVSAFLAAVGPLVSSPPVPTRYRRVGGPDPRLPQAAAQANRVTVTTTLTLKPGGAPVFVQQAAAVIAGTRKEAGNRSYELFQSVDDPNQFASFEIWTARDAVDAHLRTSHVQAFLTLVGPFLNGTPPLAYGEPLFAVNRANAGDLGDCIDRAGTFGARDSQDYGLDTVCGFYGYISRPDAWKTAVTDGTPVAAATFDAYIGGFFRYHAPDYVELNPALDARTNRAQWNDQVARVIYTAVPTVHLERLNLIGELRLSDTRSRVTIETFIAGDFVGTVHAFIFANLPADYVGVVHWHELHTFVVDRAAAGGPAIVEHTGEVSSASPGNWDASWL